MSGQEKSREQLTVPDLADLPGRASRFQYYGLLAGDNIQLVTARVRKLLTGRRYVWCSVNASPAAYSAPEVRTGQRLRPGRDLDGVTHDGLRLSHTTWTHDSEAGPGELWHLSAADTYGVWGVMTHHATEDDAHAKGQYRNVTRFLVEGFGEGTRDRIEFTQHNGYGDVLQWVIQPEARDWDEAGR